MLKVYKIDNFDNNWSCKIEINEEFLIQAFCKPDCPYTTLKAMQNMILYFYGGAERLESGEGNVSKVFAQQLAREIFYILAAENLTIEGVISEFKNREGWCQMDGSSGIKIIDVDDLNWYHDEFYVEEL